MADLKEQCLLVVADALNKLKTEAGFDGPDVAPGSLTAETPPNPEMGDVGIPLFQFAKLFRMAPPIIAQKTAAYACAHPSAAVTGCFTAAGPYVNVKLNKSAAVSAILGRVAAQNASYGSCNTDGVAPLADRRVMVEFSSPNTNKPLHLGHLRNDALGESVSRILKAAGAEVYKVNIINNRGVHICKSMLAYKKFHEAAGDTPEKLGVKSDRFVGDCYVEFDKYSKTDAAAESQAQELLVKWEQGDESVRALWKRMNDWAIRGITQTYKRTGVSFDKLYYESDTYLKGKEEILKGLADGIFYREEDGSVWVDLAEIGLDKKVLLRKDGTALYMTQDIGTAIYRHGDWAFNQLVYVVGSEQQYHFKVLFYVLKKLGYEWASRLYHLSYGMVNLPEGKMKSREGTVVDADDLINTLRDGALEEIAAKGREEAVGDPAAVAEKIALGALHYYLLQTTPTKDMLFNPKESLAFNGNTGPYLQYMGARICSILRKAADTGLQAASPAQAAALLTHETEWELVKLLGDYPSVVVKAAENLDPSQLTGFLYDVAKAFGKFYHECPAVGIASENPALASARLALIAGTRTVLENAMQLVLIPFLEAM
ncbi:arginine--tRNA ligase [Treponema brennaborense]|uniref:Arginine--tRNA ligase n=1 Tax=Treponema brennaborense (strain DSM 12168 / CIP 105900 / DD5/3) TaxID=906968 RepID=F4LJ77_TREBD|nr:arginine--tRNA ligase [Treponema brennaborense]AEE16334.1 Arginyl-tRNA synthetase [Treponema brennaborense DSM 12168]